MGAGSRETGTPAVVTRGLRKTYRSVRGVQTAVGGLDLDVPSGGVHGFLGPNGSGKTTTIRMLLGLTRPTAGTMHIFGHPVPGELPAVIDRVGAIVESPKFFPHFSAERNLRLLAGAVGAPRERVGEVIEEVGLSGRGQDRFRAYSLGMKQRLAIAATLLKSPDLLIFDEPTNGLDPAGIQEIRRTMRSLGDQGRTVLVSSHILSEVEQVADTVSIIGKGRVLAQGSVSSLISSGTSVEVEIEVAAHEVEAASAVLGRHGWEISVVTGSSAGAGTQASQPGTQVTGAIGVLGVIGAEDPREIVRALAAQDIWVSRLVPRRRGLEAVFLELTGDDAASDATTATGGGQR